MSEERRPVTAQDLLDAIEKNGYKHIRGGWFGNEYGVVNPNGSKVTSACVMGQAALNLGVDWDELHKASNAELNGFAAMMIAYNDEFVGESAKYRKYSELKRIARRYLSKDPTKVIGNLAIKNYNAVRKADA